jgi:HEAT repeat protein
MLVCFCALGLVPAGYGQTDQVSQLISKLKDSDSRVRSDSARALGSIGRPAVELLISALQDADWRVRSGAAWALASIKDARAVEPLIAALKNPASDTRTEVAEALGQFNDPRAVSTLLAALRARDTAVIAGAAYFFIGRGEPGSEDALIEALDKLGNNVDDSTKNMAQGFLNSGNSKLEQAARTWAARNSIPIMTTLPGIASGSRGRGVEWGSNR